VRAEPADGAMLGRRPKALKPDVQRAGCPGRIADAFDRPSGGGRGADPLRPKTTWSDRHAAATAPREPCAELAVVVSPTGIPSAARFVFSIGAASRGPVVGGVEQHRSARSTLWAAKLAVYVAMALDCGAFFQIWAGASGRGHATPGHVAAGSIVGGLITAPAYRSA